MKTLWTPWRMEHVQGTAEKVTGCLFEPPGTSSADKQFLLLHRDRYTTVLLNRFPYTNGHLLIAPVRHIASLTDLLPDEGAALMAMLSTATDILKNELHPDGFNVGCNLGETAGAGIAAHLHFHIVPRWDGDHNFMAVLSEIRTIPEHLLATYDRLLPPFQKISSAEES